MTINCPNCGAPLKVGTMTCEYIYLDAITALDAKRKYEN